MCISSRLYYGYPNASNGYSCCNDCSCSLVVAAGLCILKPLGCICIIHYSIIICYLTTHQVLNFKRHLCVISVCYSYTVKL